MRFIIKLDGKTTVYDDIGSLRRATCDSFLVSFEGFYTPVDSSEPVHCLFQFSNEQLYFYRFTPKAAKPFSPLQFFKEGHCVQAQGKALPDPFDENHSHQAGLTEQEAGWALADAEEIKRQARESAQKTRVEVLRTQLPEPVITLDNIQQDLLAILNPSAVAVQLTDDAKKSEIELYRWYQNHIAQGLHQSLDKLKGSRIVDASNAQKLKEFLAENWEKISNNCLCYTAHPDDALTVLICKIAVNVAGILEENPLMILMPGISVEHISDLTQNLEPKNSYALLKILKTHVLGKEGRYLIPVLLLTKLEINGFVRYGNGDKVYAIEAMPHPYFNSETMTTEMQFISIDEMKRLMNHSDQTRSIGSLMVEYQKEISNQNNNFQNNNLLAQTELLAKKLFSGGAHSAGSEMNAAAAAMTGIVDFFKFLERCDCLLVEITGPKTAHQTKNQDLFNDEALNSFRNVIANLQKYASSAELAFQIPAGFEKKETKTQQIDGKPIEVTAYQKMDQKIFIVIVDKITVRVQEIRRSSEMVWVPIAVIRSDEVASCVNSASVQLQTILSNDAARQQLLLISISEAEKNVAIENIMMHFPSAKKLLSDDVAHGNYTGNDSLPISAAMLIESQIKINEWATLEDMQYFFSQLDADDFFIFLTPAAVANIFKHLKREENVKLFSSWILDFLKPDQITAFFKGIFKDHPKDKHINHDLFRLLLTLLAKLKNKPAEFAAILSDIPERSLIEIDPSGKRGLLEPETMKTVVLHLSEDTLLSWINKPALFMAIYKSRWGQGDDAYRILCKRIQSLNLQPDACTVLSELVVKMTEVAGEPNYIQAVCLFSNSFPDYFDQFFNGVIEEKVISGIKNMSLSIEDVTEQLFRQGNILREYILPMFVMFFERPEKFVVLLNAASQEIVHVIFSYMCNMPELMQKIIPHLSIDTLLQPDVMEAVILSLNNITVLPKFCRSLSYNVLELNWNENQSAFQSLCARIEQFVNDQFQDRRVDLLCRTSSAMCDDRSQEVKLVSEARIFKICFPNYFDEFLRHEHFGKKMLNSVVSLDSFIMLLRVLSPAQITLACSCVDFNAVISNTDQRLSTHPEFFVHNNSLDSADELYWMEVTSVLSTEKRAAIFIPDTQAIPFNFKRLKMLIKVFPEATYFREKINQFIVNFSKKATVKDVIASILEWDVNSVILMIESIKKEEPYFDVVDVISIFEGVLNTKHEGLTDPEKKTIYLFLKKMQCKPLVTRKLTDVKLDEIFWSVLNLKHRYSDDYYPGVSYHPREELEKERDSVLLKIIIKLLDETVFNSDPAVSDYYLNYMQRDCNANDITFGLFDKFTHHINELLCHEKILHLRISLICNWDSFISLMRDLSPVQILFVFQFLDVNKIINKTKPVFSQIMEILEVNRLKNICVIAAEFACSELYQTATDEDKDYVRINMKKAFMTLFYAMETIQKSPYWKYHRDLPLRELLNHIKKESTPGLFSASSGETSKTELEKCGISVEMLNNALRDDVTLLEVYKKLRNRDIAKMEVAPEPVASRR